MGNIIATSCITSYSAESPLYDNLIHGFPCTNCISCLHLTYILAQARPYDVVHPSSYSIILLRMQYLPLACWKVKAQLRLRTTATVNSFMIYSSAQPTTSGSHSRFIRCSITTEIRVYIYMSLCALVHYAVLTNTQPFFQGCVPLLALQPHYTLSKPQ